MNQFFHSIFVWIIFAVFIFAPTGCNSIGHNSPSQVVVAAYMAGNEGKYSEVEKYLATDCAKAVKGDLGQLVGGIRGWMDRDTRKGTLVRIEIVKENIRGEGAEVISVFHFINGTRRDDSTKLIKENGQWRITCS